uniref:Beta-defensin n=1 Tax=Sarcophilus harrisii TaxID=9305 RepID=G3W2A3_SARHA
MKIISIFFGILFFLNQVLIDSKFIFRPKCEKNGVCRDECKSSEMLIAYCKNSQECCVLGHPWS